MKLTKARIKNFKSIQDSREFDIDDKITCLIGKNQAGKTALLEALNQFDPIKVPPNTLHPEGIDLTYALEDEDCQIIKERFGDKCLTDEYPTITVKKASGAFIEVSNLNVDSDAAVRHLVENAKLPKEQQDKILKIENIEAQIEDIEVRYNLLTGKEQIEDSEKEQINDLNRLKSELQSIQNGLLNTIYHQILQPRTPKFFHTDEYYKIEGKVNLTALDERKKIMPLEIQIAPCSQ